MTESTSTRALTGIRQMTVPIPPLRAFVDGPTAEWRTTGADTQWEILDQLGNFAYSTYVDTSGYNMDDLTVMFESIGQLQAGTTNLTGVPSCRMLIVDMVTTQSLGANNAELLQVCNEIRLGNFVPGSLISDVDFEMVQYGRFREYLAVTQGTTVQDVYVPVSDSQFGSLEATTADKLHVYRFVVLEGFFIQEILPIMTIHETRFVINTRIEKEADIPYLFRQKRSFELQQ